MCFSDMKKCSAWVCAYPGDLEQVLFEVSKLILAMEVGGGGEGDRE